MWRRVLLMLLAFGLAPQAAAGRFLKGARSGPASATVSWIAPTTDADGTAVATITNYTVRYGTVQGGPYSSAASTGDGVTLTKVITGLQSATTYYFVVTATTASGESLTSAEVETTP